MKNNTRFKFSAFAIVALCFGWGAIATDNTSALAVLPFMAIPCRKQDIDNGGGNQNGGGQADFQKQVLSGIGEVKKQYAAVEENFKTLDKDSKKLADDFAGHVKAFESMPSQVVQIERTIAQIQLKVANERRASFGSAVERISGDDEMRTIVNGMIRQAANKGGGNVPITEAQAKGADDFRRAMATTASPGSSYMNAQLIREIYSLIAEYGIWRMFDVIPVSTTSAKMIVDTTDPVMLWTAENTAPAETAYAGSNVTQTIVKMLGWIGISNELLADSEVDIGRYLLPKFANATAYRMDYTAVASNNGTATTDGGCTGIFNGGTAAVAGSTRTTIAALILEDFLACMAAVNAAALTRPCYWWIHPTNLIRVLAIKDLNGRPLFLPSTDAPSFGAIGSILGYPVVLTHAAPSANVASSKIAVFGEAAANGVALRSDFEFAASDQVKFLEDQTVFRARARGASKIKLATAFGVLTNAAS